MNIHRSIYFLIISLWVQQLHAQVKLPSLIRDSMVLQRNDTIRLWGWAAPGEPVNVRFNQKTWKTKTAKDGKWLVKLPPMKAGGPYTMYINDITLKEILIGDVFICSGQSNMVHTLQLHKDRYKQDIQNADYPMIRHFTVSNIPDLSAPDEDIQPAGWKPARGNDVLQFSAVAYFFAREIHEKYRVPIGLINASVGGSPIEAWMSEEAVKMFPDAYQVLQKNKDSSYVNNLVRQAMKKNDARPPEEDAGIKENIPWFDKSYRPVDWKTFWLPGYWEDQGLKNLDGIVWFRKVIDLPAAFSTTKSRLSLGRIVDADRVYVNGILVGQTTYQYPQRRYDIDPGILVQGKNIITIRITNYNGKGGFVPDKPYYLAIQNDTVDLRGEWLYKPGDVFEEDMAWQNGISIQNQPAALFNSMIAPLTNFSVRGILWYQGESNTHNANAYGNLLKALIQNWRKQWRTNLPFLFVQLPNFGDVDLHSRHSAWATLREEQRKVRLPNTAMAVTVDLGEWNDIHPGNKKDVGKRLALAARKIIYNEKNLVASGPAFKSANRDHHKIILSFEHADGGLITKDNKDPNWFFIASADKKFQPAKTRIDGNKIIVWNENIPDPKYIRYAMADNPEGANLYNREGLPASPFEANIISGIQDPERPWNNKKAAVVLTYDDALNVHLTNAIPTLNAAGIKGTFYISDYFGGLRAQITGWRSAAANGHELGNHTMFHPCLGNLPGRSWVNPDYDLSKYSIKRITDEILAMNNLLYSIDGKQERTFAFPCNDTHIKDSFYLDASRHSFIAARAVRSEMLSPGNVELFNIPAYMVNGETGEQLIALVKKAVRDKKLLVFLFHGVGGEHSLNDSPEAHNELISYLQLNKEDIWIAPLIDVSNYIRNIK